MANLLASAVLGAELALSGTGSNSISFGSAPGAKAIFTGSCDGLTPHTSYVHPSQVVYDSAYESTNVTLHLRNVPPTCRKSAIHEPCAVGAGEVSYPPLFYCHWSAAQGGGPLSHHKGPSGHSASMSSKAGTRTRSRSLSARCRPTQSSYQ